MITISYHGGHSKDICDHAEENKRTVISSYLKKGFKHVGITEHLPPPNDFFLYDGEIALGHDASFLNQRFENYFEKEIPKLKKELNLSSDYLFGFETEFYGEDPEAHIKKAISKYNPEIVVASLHHVADIPIDESIKNHDKAVVKVGGIEELYLEYYDQQLKLIRCLGKFSNKIPIVLGHMDVIRKHTPEFKLSEKILTKVSRNIKAAIERNFAFEINTRALTKGMKEPYPQKNILDLIIEAKGIITLGDDSHSAKDVGLHYERLSEFYTGSFNVVKKNNNGFEWIPFAE